MILKNKRRLVLAVIVCVFSVATSAFAYTIDQIQVDPTKQDFVVGPGKTDITLEPGHNTVVEVMVSNRTGKDREFSINFEDFKGSHDLSSPIILASEQGLSSMSDFISVPEKTFFLRNGERARIPVTVSVPAGAEPGGRYVSILVSTLTPLEKTGNEEGVKGGVPLITQTGTLVFITVPGDVKTEVD